MTSNYKVDVRELNSISNKHIAPVTETEKVKLQTYYRTRRLSNLIIKKQTIEKPQQRYEEPCCLPVQVRYGRMKFLHLYWIPIWSLYERLKMHAQTGSIIQHLRNAHNINRVSRRQLLDKTEVIALDRDKRRLVMWEALLIKEKKPSMKSQAEGRN